MGNVNQPSSRDPRFKAGDRISAFDLESLVDAVARRITGIAPLYSRTANRQIVIGINAPDGKPFVYPTVPAKIASIGFLDACTVDFFENGFTEAATQEGISATVVDDEAILKGDQKVSVFLCNGLYYVISGSGSSGGVSPGKIRAVISPTVYQVDLYDDDYPNPITKTVTAELIDLNSVPFVVSEQVEVFLDRSKIVGDRYYIGTCKPWVPNAMPPTWDAKITASLGGGSYQVRQVVAPGGAFVPGGPTFTVIESILSPLVLVGTYVEVDSVGTGYRITFPLGDGS